MKAIVAIFSILLAIQVSWAEHGDCSTKEPEVLYDKFQYIAGEIETIVRDAVEEFYKTKAYGDYVEKWQYFLDVFEEKKKRKEPCLQKVLNTISNFFDLMQPYQEDRASKEDQKILEIFNEKGFSEIYAILVECKKGYSEDEMNEAVDIWVEEKNEIVTNMC